jgi:hypothetical protein
MEPSKTPTGKSISKVIGTIIAVAGAAALAYGAAAFWLVRSLPPNTADSRLPSLYLMGAAMLATVVGLVTRDFRWQ